MRTTIDIADDSYSRLKAQAALERTSVKALINRAVHENLETPKDADPETTGRRVHWPKFGGTAPGTLTFDNESIAGLLDL